MREPHARWSRRMARVPATLGEIVRHTAAGAWRNRVLGMSAEAAFWAMLSLPSLFLGLLGAVGYVHLLFGKDILIKVQQEVIEAARRVLAPSAVDNVVRPVIAELLRRGHPTTISIGFVLSLWAGSTAMSDYVNTITIAYGQRDLRSAVRSRLLAFGLYLVALAVGSVVLPLLIAGPALAGSVPLPARGLYVRLVAYGYWPTTVVLCVLALTTLYHVAVPVRTRWRHDLPGALLAVAIWLAGSYLLRAYLGFALRAGISYAGIGATIAALLFLYVTSLAILIGAEFNAELARRRRLLPVACGHGGGTGRTGG